jgi:hypothetical protein
VSFASATVRLGADAVDDGDRAEELLPVGVHGRRDARQHRAGEVVAGARAAGRERRALRDRAAQLGLQPVRGGARRQRPHGRVGRRRVAGLDCGERGRQAGDEGLVEVVDDDEPLGGVARLAGVLDPRGHRRGDDGVEVVAAEQDERIGAAELEHDL